MADSLVNGHERPRLDGSASCPSYYSLGMRRKEAGLAARLPVQIYCNRLDFSENAVQAHPGSDYKLYRSNQTGTIAQTGLHTAFSNLTTRTFVL